MYSLLTPQRCKFTIQRQLYQSFVGLSFLRTGLWNQWKEWKLLVWDKVVEQKADFFLLLSLGLLLSGFQDVTSGGFTSNFDQNEKEKSSYLWKFSGYLAPWPGLQQEGAPGDWWLQAWLEHRVLSETNTAVCRLHWPKHPGHTRLNPSMLHNLYNW